MTNPVLSIKKILSFVRKIRGSHKLLLLFAFLVCLVGCEASPVLYGGVKVNKTNGQVSTIEVNIMGSSHVVRNREQADKLIDHLESILADVKAGRDQMTVEEP